VCFLMFCLVFMCLGVFTTPQAKHKRKTPRGVFFLEAFLQKKSNTPQPPEPPNKTDTGRPPKEKKPPPKNKLLGWKKHFCGVNFVIIRPEKTPQTHGWWAVLENLAWKTPQPRTPQVPPKRGNPGGPTKTTNKKKKKSPNTRGNTSR